MYPSFVIYRFYLNRTSHPHEEERDREREQGESILIVTKIPRERIHGLPAGNGRKNRRYKDVSRCNKYNKCADTVTTHTHTHTTIAAVNQTEQLFKTKGRDVTKKDRFRKEPICLSTLETQLLTIKAR